MPLQAFEFPEYVILCAILFLMIADTITSSLCGKDIVRRAKERVKEIQMTLACQTLQSACSDSFRSSGTFRLFHVEKHLIQKHKT